MSWPKQRPGDTFAPHPRNVDVVIALSDLERLVAIEALCEYEADLRERDHRSLARWVRLRRLRAVRKKLENPDGSTSFDSHPGVAKTDVHFVHMTRGDLSGALIDSLQQYALDNGANVHESFGDRETALATATFDLADELLAISKRVSEVWG